jgi:hypothetical protein
MKISSERFYRIRHRATGKYSCGIKYERKKNCGSTEFPIIDFADEPNNLCAKSLSNMVRNFICRKMQAQLDECEIETIEVIHKPIKGTIRMKNIKNRIEQQELVRLLKA